MAEDDGVLLSQAYFGKEGETKLLVFDARSMEVMATVSTGMTAPLDFHGAWVAN
jgi:carotenoid cleavage dioxygenase-like enzyme